MKKSKTLLLALFSFASTTLLAQQQNNWTWGGPLDPEQAKYDVKHYTLRLAVAPQQKRISGSVDVRVKVLEPTDLIRLNLIDAYTVDAVKVNGKKAGFTRTPDGLDVQLRKKVQPGQVVTVQVGYAGLAPEAVRPPWQGGFTFAQDANGKHWVGLSSQNEGAKIFMPCKDHPSDEPDEGVTQYITVPAGYVAAANGLLQGQTQQNGSVTYHWQSNYTTNNYGINFTVGDFVALQREYTTIEGNKMPMVVYLLRQNESKLPELMDVLETSLRTQEKYFGEYPFWKEKAGVVETPYLGMEHQTINAYGNKFRFTKVGQTTHDNLLYHELGHEWWGNKVSVRDWADFWIQEGLCSYGDWLFVEEHAGHEAYLKHVQQVARSIPNRTPIIQRENMDSDEAYHGEIYTKGAHVMHSLRFLLGEELFFKTIRGFLSSPAHTYANQVKTADLQQYITEHTGQDIAPFFDLYLRTTEVPEVLVQKLGADSYAISIPNINFALPMDVQTDTGTQRLTLSKEPQQVKSAAPPLVDAQGWYLKRIRTEKGTL
ncbi:M1 family metallopeptidase [Pontibacter actiniarum]|uniref:Uncharacterized protein n=1 Tax=Pontibacter actiniarum TaxID=323450 RepID=A0A1X9YPG5_9BACT|nr:M1 family metallopeptidase [Pontibacter actiniarum]ARS34747.1 hypothetical protein CA264_04430 [Pontibacter actiniarum]